MAVIVGLNGQEVSSEKMTPHKFTFVFHNDKIPVQEEIGFLSVTSLFIAVVDQNDLVKLVTNTSDIAYVRKGEAVEEVA
jgi:hypothetical protein